MKALTVSTPVAQACRSRERGWTWDKRVTSVFVSIVDREVPGHYVRNSRVFRARQTP